MFLLLLLLLLHLLLFLQFFTFVSAFLSQKLCGAANGHKTNNALWTTNCLTVIQEQQRHGNTDLILFQFMHLELVQATQPMSPCVTAFGGTKHSA